MKTRSILVTSCAIAAIASVSSAQAPSAAPPRVTEVIVLDVGSNMQKFFDLTKRADAITKELQNPGKARYWISSWAGSEAGHVIVTIEFPSLLAMAQAEAKMNASPEFQKWIAEAQASGIKQLSQSIVTELRQ